MKCIKRFLPILFLASTLFADIPPIRISADVQAPTMFDITTRAGNTPVIIADIMANGSNFLDIGSGWTPEFNYTVKDYSSSLKVITGVLDSATA